MKKLLLLLILASTIAFTGCTKTKDVKTKEVKTKDVKTKDVKSKDVKTKDDKSKDDKYKEEKCKEVMNHVIKLTMDSPQIKAMMKDPEKAKKIKEGMKKNAEKGIKRCVVEFKEDTYKCLMNAKKAEDMMKCKTKK